MTESVQSPFGVSATPLDRAAAPSSGQGAPVTVDVSRSQAAPIYVYRVTDTATGRTLVEIPTQQPIADPQAPGSRLDAKI